MVRYAGFGAAVAHSGPDALGFACKTDGDTLLPLIERHARHAVAER